MKIVLYIITSCCIVFCQTSSLSIFGMGEYIDSYDASSMSMGDSKYFNGTSDYISFSSPSSYWKSALSNLMMSVNYSNTSFAGGFDNTAENNFRMISFTFPVKKNHVMAIGMNPLFRTDLVIEEQDYSFISANNSPTGEPLAYNTDYEFSGGMSEFFIIYSAKVSDNLSLGLRCSKIFGNSNHEYSLNLYDVSYDINEFIQYNIRDTEFFIDKNRYSSNKYLFELRYSIAKFESVFTYSKSSMLKLKVTPYYDTLGFLESQSYYTSNKLFDKGLGIKYNLSNNSGISFEHHIVNPYNFYEFLNIFNENTPNIKSNHIGVYFSENNNTFKFGLFNKFYDFDNKRITDNGLTLGMRFEYFENKNSADIAIMIGERSNVYGSIGKESYFKIMLTIVSGEEWFVNERKK